MASGGGGPSLFSATLEQQAANVARLRAWERAHPAPVRVTTTTTVRRVTTTVIRAAPPPPREHR